MNEIMWSINGLDGDLNKLSFVERNARIITPYYARDIPSIIAAIGEDSLKVAALRSLGHEKTHSGAFSSISYDIVLAIREERWRVAAIEVIVDKGFLTASQAGLLFSLIREDDHKPKAVKLLLPWLASSEIVGILRDVKGDCAKLDALRTWDRSKKISSDQMFDLLDLFQNPFHKRSALAIIEAYGSTEECGKVAEVSEEIKRAIAAECEKTLDTYRTHEGAERKLRESEASLTKTLMEGDEYSVQNGYPRFLDTDMGVQAGNALLAIRNHLGQSLGAPPPPVTISVGGSGNVGYAECVVREGTDRSPQPFQRLREIPEWQTRHLIAERRATAQRETLVSEARMAAQREAYQRQREEAARKPLEVNQRQREAYQRQCEAALDIDRIVRQAQAQDRGPLQRSGWGTYEFEHKGPNSQSTQCIGINNSTEVASFPNVVSFEYPRDKIGEDTKATEGQETCVVCLDNVYRTVNLPCWHACLCFACSEIVADTPVKKCPLCRVDLTEIKAFYKA